jgi:hypothetical protein
MSYPKVFVDFGNADAKGRVRLNCAGTLADLTRQNVQLRDGMVLALYSDDENVHGQPDELRAVGTVEYSVDEKAWVASIDWDAVHHASAEVVTGRPERRSAAG